MGRFTYAAIVPFKLRVDEITSEIDFSVFYREGDGCINGWYAVCWAEAWPIEPPADPAYETLLVNRICKLTPEEAVKIIAYSYSEEGCISEKEWEQIIAGKPTVFTVNESACSNVGGEDIAFFTSDKAHLETFCTDMQIDLQLIKENKICKQTV